MRVLAFACAIAAAAATVHIDVGKLTDFTTTFQADSHSLNLDQIASGDPQAFPADAVPFGVKVTGKIIANIPGKKLKVRVDFSGGTRVPISGAGNYSLLLTFDGAEGKAGIHEWLDGDVHSAQIPGGVIGFQGDGCVTMTFNPNVLPPSAWIKSQIDQMKEQIDPLANQVLPHITVDGVAYYSLQDAALGVHENDGTPIGLWAIDNPEFITKDGATWLDSENTGWVDDWFKTNPPFLKFGPFTPAESFEVLECTSSVSHDEMLAKPKVQWGLSIIENVLKHMQLSEPIQPLTSHIIAQAPQILRHAGENSNCVETGGTTLAERPVSQLGYIGLIAGFAGGAGSFIAFFVARYFSDKQSEGVYLQI